MVIRLGQVIDRFKAKKFMELFNLPLQDINEQNTKMNEGEKSKEDIKKHVMNWIKKNQSTHKKAVKKIFIL